MSNPWVRSPAVDVETVVEPEADESSDDDYGWRPLVSVGAPADALPVFEVDGDGPRLWLVGAHGGAGTSTLARLCGAGDAGQAWPVGSSFTNVVVVARGNMSGLKAAQRAALQWTSGAVPSVNLVGVAFVADCSGREPRRLRDFRRFVSGGFPQAWFVPWVEQWRVDDVDDLSVPRGVRKVILEISQKNERTRK